MPKYNLEGKVVLVTGAAAGIGRAIALMLANEGAKLSLADIDPNGLEQTAELIKTLENPPTEEPLWQSVDVTDETLVNACVMATIKRFGQIDVLVNNAGIFPRCPLLEMSGAEWDVVLDVNLKGLFHCAKAAGMAMVNQGDGGRIIAISSSAGFEGVARGVHYSASKAGIIGFVKALSLELAPHNITVNAVAPGITDTMQPRQGLSEEQIAARAQVIPLGRIGQAEDVAEAVLWLASSASAYITGQTIHINGGSLRY